MDQILITGATGAIAREILAAMLARRRHAAFALLVRGRDGSPAPERFDSILRYVRFYEPGLDLSNVRLVEGEVTLPRLGLSPLDHAPLLRETTHIIHCAAGAAHGMDPVSAQRINVDGTAEALRFAEACPRLERFGYMSAAGIAGRREGRIMEDELFVGQRFADAYEGSMCVAEAMVSAARRRLPITIFRPTIVAGASAGGRIAAFSAIYQSILAVATGRARILAGDGAVRLDVVPVDFVARAVAALVDHPRAVGRTYHLAAGDGGTVSAREVLERSVALLGGPSQPRLRFVDAGGASPAARRLAALSTALEHEKRFDTAHLREDLGDAFAPAITLRDLLPKLLAFFASTRFGASMPWEETPCLAAA